MQKVSLYIPCYNAEKTIRECLESVMVQSYDIDEILVIDDGSCDRTAEIAQRYPVKILTHKENKGLSACRNAAFRQARNEFVAALDADCVAQPGWLKELMGCFEHDDIAGSGGKLNERHSSAAADRWRLAHMSQGWGENSVNNPAFLYGSNTVFKKKAIALVGFYNERFRNNYEDVDISMRIYSAGLRLIYNPQAQAEHLRQDTPGSVLKAYWQWTCRQPDNGIEACPGLLQEFKNKVKYPGIIRRLALKDFRNQDYGLLLLDFIFLFYYPWFEFKYRLCKNTLSR